MGSRPTVPLCRPVPLGALLARWWAWRRSYQTERGYARLGGPSEPEDVLEQMLMNSVENEVCSMPLDLQRTVEQMARDECLGVDHGQPHNATLAAIQLQSRLQRMGLLV